jgi:DNA-binding XRE family transcriptional regulator
MKGLIWMSEDNKKIEKQDEYIKYIEQKLDGLLEKYYESKIVPSIKEVAQKIYEENREDNIVGMVNENKPISEYRWYEGYGDPTVDEYAIPVIFDVKKKYKVENCLNGIVERSGKKKGWIARMVGISDKNLSAILLNKANPSITTVLLICAVLGVTCDQVYRLVEIDDKEK